VKLNGNLAKAAADLEHAGLGGECAAMNSTVAEVATSIGF